MATLTFAAMPHDRNNGVAIYKEGATVHVRRTDDGHEETIDLADSESLILTLDFTAPLEVQS